MARRPNPATEQRWLDLVRRWQCSGQSVRAFCRRQRLSAPSFYLWRRRLRQRGRLGPPDAAPPAFVKLTVAAAPAARPALELVLAGGRVLRVPPGFDAASLRQLLRLLEEPPC
jgi:transposase-like protein